MSGWIHNNSEQIHILGHCWRRWCIMTSLYFFQFVFGHMSVLFWISISFIFLLCLTWILPSGWRCSALCWAPAALGAETLVTIVECCLLCLLETFGNYFAPRETDYRILLLFCHQNKWQVGVESFGGGPPETMAEPGADLSLTAQSTQCVLHNFTN